EANFKHLLKAGSTSESKVAAFSMAQLHDLVGFDEVWAFEKRFVES
ncbi:MAG: carboxyvinyl-carboxyphosphonate phosphorylmutase, partial [Betaproteobacteria bacterium]|nr:carboxyvinyl-carboxyphosphonate phosphorylmutase [Betaproteobacteria bacterium]